MSLLKTAMIIGGTVLVTYLVTRRLEVVPAIAKAPALPPDQKYVSKADVLPGIGPLLSTAGATSDVVDDVVELLPFIKCVSRC